MSAPDSVPSLSRVVALAVTACAAMAVALYFAGQQQLPVAMTGTVLFIALGGTAFELARRRSRARG